MVHYMVHYIVHYMGHYIGHYIVHDKVHYIVHYLEGGRLEGVQHAVTQRAGVGQLLRRRARTV